MLVALDVAYFGTRGHAVAVAFTDWTTAEVTASYSVTLDQVLPYEPGAFYKRELPCLLAVLAQVDLAVVSCLLVDGYVTLGAEARPGLGQYLHLALDRRLPVVGVAKTRFAGVGPQVASVRRGHSQNPLYVTSVGLPLAEAARLVGGLPGPYRFPTVLKHLDDLTKNRG